jgi:hypothetical protein
LHRRDCILWPRQHIAGGNALRHVGELRRSISDSVSGFGDVLPIATLRWNAGVHNYMTYITGDDDSVYVSLRCPACARVHLVNRKGRTLMSHPTS